MIASQLTNLEGPFALAHTWVPYTYHLLAGQQAVDFYPVTRKDRAYQGEIQFVVSQGLVSFTFSRLTDVTLRVKRYGAENLNKPGGSVEIGRAVFLALLRIIYISHRLVRYSLTMYCILTFYMSKLPFKSKDVKLCSELHADKTKRLTTLG